MISKIFARIKPDGDGYLVRMILKDANESADGADRDIFNEKSAFQELSCQYQEQEVFAVVLGNAISKDPYISFRLEKLASGDNLILLLRDSQGVQDRVELKVP